MSAIDRARQLVSDPWSVNDRKDEYVAIVPELIDHAERAERRAKLHLILDDLLNARFDDGGSVLEYIFATDPELKETARRVFGFDKEESL